MHYKLVYFFGPDGTGKTMQADLIAAYLTSKGIPNLRRRVKQHHTFSYLLLKLFRSNYNDYLKANFFGFGSTINLKIRRPWQIVEILSIIPAIAYRVILPSMAGYTIVCDRYIIDTIVVLAKFLDDPSFILGKTARILLKILPKNSILIFLDAKTETILLRKKDEPITKELINQYRQSYKEVLYAFKIPAVEIDTTNNSILNVHHTVKEMFEL